MCQPPFHVLQANSSFCDGFANPTCGVQFVENFLSSHVAVATALGKPLIIEEFGKGNLAGVPQSEPERIQDFSAIYNALSTSLAANGPIKGVPQLLRTSVTAVSTAPRHGGWIPVAAKACLVRGVRPGCCSGGKGKGAGPLSCSCRCRAWHWACRSGLLGVGFLGKR